MGILDNLGGNPLFNVGMGLLSASGPSLTPQNPWMGGYKGLLAAQAFRQQQAEDAQRQKQIEAQTQMQQMALAQAQQKAQADADLRDALASGDQGRVAAALARAAPATAASKLFATQNPVGVSAGETLVDPVSGRVIFQAPADQTKLTYEQRMALAQARGGVGPERTMAPQLGINPETNKPEYWYPTTAGGQRWTGISPYAVSTDPEKQRDAAAARTGGAKEGEAAAAAITDEQKALDAADYTISLATRLRDHPGMSEVVGVPDVTTLGGRTWASKGAGFRAMRDQLQGRAFLDAYQMLKGSGQITEIEGQKATDAIIRAQSAQSEADFKEAMGEFIGIVKQGQARAKSAAAKGRQILPSRGSAAPAAGVRLKFDAQGNQIP